MIEYAQIDKYVNNLRIIRLNIHSTILMQHNCIFYEIEINTIFCSKNVAWQWQIQNLF